MRNNIKSEEQVETYKNFNANFGKVYDAINEERDHSLNDSEDDEAEMMPPQPQAQFAAQMQAPSMRLGSVSKSKASAPKARKAAPTKSAFVGKQSDSLSHQLYKVSNI